ncbi:MAG: DUF952 domain-containing protein, partial [Anaerolineae bacterium]
MNEYVVHICTQQAWQAAQAEGTYRPESLTTEGFIHLSRPEQALGTANRFFAGQRDLVLLWIPVEKLTAPLKWEAADGDVFPHLYGALPVAAVAAVTAFPPDADG